MIEQENKRKLEEMARWDTAFRTWHRSYEDCQAAFHAYAEAQPEEVRQILYGYAESGRLMYQRMVNLACTYMVFPEEPEYPEDGDDEEDADWDLEDPEEETEE